MEIPKCFSDFKILLSDMTTSIQVDPLKLVKTFLNLKDLSTYKHDFQKVKIF